MTVTNKLYSLFALILLPLISCGGEESHRIDNNESILKYAKYLKLKKHEGGWYEAIITKPGDTLKTVQHIAILPDSVNVIPEDLPKEATLIRTPLKNALVQSTVHVGLLEEFGASEAIGGVSDVEFIKSPHMQQKLKEGSVINCGGWLNPDIEKIMKLMPDAIFLSPYQNGGTYGHVTELGYPVVYVADYMEKEPLARSEWMRYYGLLFNEKETADSLFASVEKNYNEILEKTKAQALNKERKKILMDLPSGGTWAVPSSGSTNHTLIENAGGENLFSTFEGDQFALLSPEKVLMEAKDADVWIIRYNTNNAITLSFIGKECKEAKMIKAFNEGNVWACNTNDTFYFEETPFHPDYILQDFYNIIHNPEDDSRLRYFYKIE